MTNTKTTAIKSEKTYNTTANKHIYRKQQQQTNHITTKRTTQTTTPKQDTQNTNSQAQTLKQNIQNQQQKQSHTKTNKPAMSYRRNKY